MKKQNKIIVKGKKRNGYAVDHIPVSKGEVIKVNKDSYEILWEDCVTPITIKKEKVKEHGKKYKNRELISLEKE